eukprot:g23464.t1
MSEEDDETAYKRFREVHNRSSTGDQLTYQQRLENFRKFRAAVEQHNSRSDVSWTAVITKPLAHCPRTRSRIAPPTSIIAVERVAVEGLPLSWHMIGS